jgi:hypothetical protein
MVTTMKKYLFTLMVAALISGCLHKEEPKEPAPSADHMINGQVPPMTPTRAAEQSIALEVIDDDRELLTEKTVRSVGTRAPIHLHLIRRNDIIYGRIRTSSCCRRYLLFHAVGTSYDWS